MLETSELVQDFVPTGTPEIVGLEIEQECIGITMKRGMPTIFVGHTGVAKTMLLRRVHQERSWPYRSVAGHAQVEVDTLVGKIWIQDGTMMFRPGILPFCMINGIAIGFQEINAVAPEVLIMLHEYLDEGRITITDLPHDHEYFVIRPHERFRIYGTMNPPDLYPGTRGLSPALMRRCIVRRVEPLPEPQEIMVVGAQGGVDAPTAAKLVKVARGMRKNMAENKADYFMSTADVVLWARISKDTGNLNRAAEIAIYGKAPLNDTRLLQDEIIAVIGRNA